jgi:hypothetical protein
LDVLERRLSSIAKVDHRHLRASALEARLKLRTNPSSAGTTPLLCMSRTAHVSHAE